MLKFNDGPKCVGALYRLFQASCMLHNVKVPGRTKPHNYPKVQYSFLLILRYWKKIHHCTWKMMARDMGVFNEEMGEITFSILSLVVRGDTQKSDFDHMNDMYSLLPLYRDIKEDVLTDHNVKNSLSWRHKVKPRGEEVATAEVFFRKIIRQIVNNKYRPYDGKVSHSTSAYKANLNLSTKMTPRVYMTKLELDEYVTKTSETVRSDVNSYWVHRNSDIWPESKPDTTELSDDDTYEEEPVPSSLHDMNSDCSQDRTYLSGDEISSISGLSHDNDSPPPSPPTSPEQSQEDQPQQNDHLNRSWHAWGTIHDENTTIGKRRIKQTQIFAPTKRRLL